MRLLCQLDQITQQLEDCEQMFWLWSGEKKIKSNMILKGRTFKIHTFWMNEWTNEPHGKMCAGWNYEAFGIRSFWWFSYVKIGPISKYSIPIFRKFCINGVFFSFIRVHCAIKRPNRRVIYVVHCENLTFSTPCFCQSEDQFSRLFGKIFQRIRL